MKVRIVLQVEFDKATTELSADDHASEIIAAIENAIGHGLLTSHEPTAEIRCWEISSEDV